MLPLSDATLAYGEDMARALLGVDALYRALAPEGEQDDGLVVVNMAPDHQPERFATYADARAHLAELARRAEALPEPNRRVYYSQLCDSRWPSWSGVSTVYHSPINSAGSYTSRHSRSQTRNWTRCVARCAPSSRAWGTTAI